MQFGKDSFVKIVAINGDYRYGYIQDVQEKGFHILVCMHEEGDSAVEYEAASGTLSSDWDKLLSDTERLLIPLLSQKLTTKEMANELSISPSTIRAHIRTLRFKLQLDNRQQLIAFAHGMNKHLKKKEE